jgi:acyl-coenzyme A synthetase/AMP-(fatty) acid ligase
MQHALMERLPKYKIPIDLHFVDEIPKKSNFKINRFIVSQLVNNQLLANTSGQKKVPYL